ncbi:BlaI/MecI/CopY family transcriptional regulator [Enterococcus sp. LJL120]
MKELTKRERQIMEVFWHAGEPLSISDAHNLASDISKNTIAAVIKKLFQNDLLKIDSVGYSGTVLTRKYLPTISEETFVAREMSQESLSNLVANFIDSSPDLASLGELEDMINKRKSQLEEGGD